MSCGQSPRYWNRGQDAAEDIIDVHTVHLGFGSKTYTVPQTRQGECFDVVGGDEVAS
jgi:hypothetical protein